MFKLFMALLLLLAVAACATPYNHSGVGLMGGVEAQMITNDTARISARGNGYTDRARIVDFVLLKSAETAAAGGFTHFSIISSSDASKVGTITTPGSITTNVYGNAAYSTYNPGSVDTFIKPGQDVFVRFCKESVEKCPGFPAQEIIRNLGPRYLSNQ
jgi:hypothetical protein